MNEITMRQILSNTPRFSSRAEYFSGRGATLTDLNYEILNHIKTEIEKHYGEDAKKAFVAMVASMENCNATDFINNCYRLEGNDFKWTEKKTNKVGHEIQKDENGEYNLAHGMASIISAFGNDRDDTDQIRNRFLLQNGIELTRRQMMSRNGYYKY